MLILIYFVICLLDRLKFYICHIHCAFGGSDHYEQPGIFFEFRHSDNFFVFFPVCGESAAYGKSGPFLPAVVDDDYPDIAPEIAGAELEAQVVFSVAFYNFIDALPDGCGSFFAIFD